MSRLAAALLYIIALAGPALAQNPVCPTRPPGDSSNACASTAFVQSAVPLAAITGLTGDVAATGPGSATATIQPGVVTSGKMAAGAAATNVGTLGGVLTSTLPNPGLGSAVVGNSNLANMAAGTIKGNNTGSSGAPLDLTGLQAEGVLQFLQSGTGATQRSLDSWIKSNAVRASDFVAAGAANAQNTTVNVTINSGTATLAVGTATFASTDCQTGTGCTGTNGNKVITVGGIGAAGAPLQTTIAGFTDSTHITLGANASTSRSSVSEPIIWGTDNTTALQNWLNACSSCYLDNGRYLITSALTPSVGAVISGAGKFSAEITQANPGANSISYTTPSSSIQLYRFTLSQYMPSTTTLVNITGVSQQFGAMLVDLYLFGGSTAVSASNVQYFIIDRVVGLNQTSQFVNYDYPLTCSAGVFRMSNSIIDVLTGNGIVIGAAGAVTLSSNGIGTQNQPNGIGVFFQSTTACAGGDVFIDNNNIESWGIGVQFNKGSETQGGNNHITNNEFAFNGSSVLLGDANDNWIVDVAITGNNFDCTSTGTCLQITTSVRNATVTGNTFTGVSGSPTGLNINSANATGIARNNTFTNLGTNVSNSSAKFLAENLVNGHVMTVGPAPTLTAGCNGAGNSISGTDMSGTVIGQTAAATTCTLTFAQAYAAAPNCVVSGISSPLQGSVTIGTSTLVVNFASSGNYRWTYSCPGN